MPRNNDGSVILPINFTQEDKQNKSFTGEKLDLPLTDLAEIAANSLDVFSRNSMQADLKMGGNRITGVKDGVELTDVATVAQASGSDIFAEDISNDASKIDLVQKPAQSIKKYENGLRVTFIVKNPSVNKMHIQLNGLGYKELDHNQVGIGSFPKNALKTVMYWGVGFVPANEVNMWKHYTLINDFNDYKFPTKIWCNVDKAKNRPAPAWGVLEYISGGYYGTQIYYGEDGFIYVRAFCYDKEPEKCWWTNWRRLIGHDEKKF